MILEELLDFELEVVERVFAPFELGIHSGQLC